MARCLECRKSFPQSKAVGLCRGCTIKKQEHARVAKFGLPGLAWRYFPRREFTRLALAAWIHADNMAEQVAGQIATAILFGMPISSHEPAHMGLVGITGSELFLVTLEESQTRDVERFDYRDFQKIYSPAWARTTVLPLAGLRAVATEQNAASVVRLEGDASLEILFPAHDDQPEWRKPDEVHQLPLTLVFPESYLRGNQVEGLRLALAINGGKVPPANYDPIYAHLKGGTLLAVEPEFNLAIPPHHPEGEFARRVLEAVAPSDPFSNWRLAHDLPPEQRQGALGAFAPGLPPEAVLALGDTTWFSTGEWGVLLAPHAVYFRDASQSGQAAYAHLEDVRHEGGSVQIDLSGGATTTIALGNETFAALVARFLDQMLRYHAHQRYTAARKP